MPALRSEPLVHNFNQVEVEAPMFDNVIGGRLKLKGKALDVKAGGIKKKKKKSSHTQQHYGILTGLEDAERQALNSSEADTGSDGGNQNYEDRERKEKQPSAVNNYLTPAERRYHEQRARTEAGRLAKIARKSHRQRVEEFNQYLANLSEHYDIPKVGPG